MSVLVSWWRCWSLSGSGVNHRLSVWPEVHREAGPLFHQDLGVIHPGKDGDFLLDRLDWLTIVRCTIVDVLPGAVALHVVARDRAGWLRLGGFILLDFVFGNLV